MAASPDEIRLRYLYRRVILRGNARLPLEAAKRLVGPDCAFHLYAAMQGPRGEKNPEEQPGPDEQPTGCPGAPLRK